MTALPVAILGAGMMTGVGLTAPASCAAIRCAIDNFTDRSYYETQNNVESRPYMGGLASTGIHATPGYPLTVTDAYSRDLIACVALQNTKTATVQRALVKIFDEFGLPERIRSDNGSPFASAAPCGLSELSIWWMRLGITHERIEPGKPQQNGRHERFHLTLKQETATPPCSSRIGITTRVTRRCCRARSRRPAPS